MFFIKRVLAFTVIFVALASIGLFVFSLSSHEVQIRLDPSYDGLFTEKQLKELGHIEQVETYNTEVSQAYKNTDGSKTIYIFASPIRYRDENGASHDIDTRIDNVNDPAYRNLGYIYKVADNDIQSFFPKALDTTTGFLLQKDYSCQIGINTNKPIASKYKSSSNFIDESKKMVVYQNVWGKGSSLNAYPTRLGINLEIKLQQSSSNVLSFWLEVDEGLKLVKSNGGYLTIVSNDYTGDSPDQIVSVIQLPLLKDEKGNVFLNNRVDFTKVDARRYEINFSFDENICAKETTAFISFEMRRDKQPDNSIYSGLPDLTYSYLSNIAVIGNQELIGTGRLMIRYKLPEIVKSFDVSKITAADFCTYSFTSTDQVLSLSPILEDWCSLTGNWNKSYRYGPAVASSVGKRGELNFDITQSVKNWCLDKNGTLEHNGLLLASEKEMMGNFDIILSNDNSIFNTRTIINVKE